VPENTSAHNRIIFHIDMNSFFASVEQAANPFIRGKPIGVGSPGYDNAALVAISYEAKKLGVPKMCRLKDARALCPEIMVIPFDPLKYYSVNRQIVKILREYSPLVEVYSIDEAFIDLTPVMHLYPGKTPADLAQEIKDRIRTEISESLTSSVGIAPNKLLAKVASNFKKPDGLTVITWENRFDFLDKVKIGDVWGIGWSSGAKLESIGVRNTADLRKVGNETLQSLVGTYWTRLVMIANGESYDPVNPDKGEKPHKTMQHAHTLGDPTDDKEWLQTYLRKMAERLARRLRRYKQTAAVVSLGLKPTGEVQYGWGSNARYWGIEKLEIPTDHGKDIYAAACAILDRCGWQGEKIRQVVVGIADLASSNQLMLDLFVDVKAKNVDRAFDEINSRYGAFTIRSADILNQHAKESELSVEREDMVFHPTSQ
jgi:DNA polymerase IV